MTGSEPCLPGHLRILVHGAELRAEMIAPDGRELFLRPLRRRGRVVRRPGDVGYDEATAGIEQRKGRVEEELPRIQVEDHLGYPDTVEGLAPAVSQVLAHLLHVEIEDPDGAGASARRGGGGGGGGGGAVLHEVRAGGRRWW
jgi:hypothetical protein